MLLTKPAVECVVNRQVVAEYLHPGQLRAHAPAAILCPVPLGPAVAQLDELDHIRVYLKASSDVTIRWCVANANVDFIQYNLTCSSVTSPYFNGGHRIIYVPRPTGAFSNAVLSTIEVYGETVTLSGYSYVAKK